MVFEKIRAIICEQLCIDEDKVVMKAKFVELGADELDMVDIAMSIEDEFQIEVTEEALESFHIVEDVVNYIDEH